MLNARVMLTRYARLQAKPKPRGENQYIVTIPVDVVKLLGWERDNRLSFNVVDVGGRLVLVVDRSHVDACRGSPRG